MDAFTIVICALFLANLGALGILLCMLITAEGNTSRAMDKRNFSRIDFRSTNASAGDALEGPKALQWNLVYYAILPYGALYGLSLLPLFND